MTAAANAVDMVDTWIVSRLASDGPLAALGNTGVYNSAAGDEVGATYPLTIFASLSGKDTTAMAAQRVLSTQRYLLKCVTDTNDQTVIAPIAARVDLLLHGAKYVPWAAGYILSCVRTNTFARTTGEAGVLYREINLEYLIAIQGG